ncbi:MAG: hypothetical protein ABW168_00800 [Sedimenticola sp.]
MKNWFGFSDKKSEQVEQEKAAEPVDSAVLPPQTAVDAQKDLALEKRVVTPSQAPVSATTIGIPVTEDIEVAKGEVSVREPLKPETVEKKSKGRWSRVRGWFGLSKEEVAAEVQPKPVAPPDEGVTHEPPKKGQVIVKPLTLPEVQIAPEITVRQDPPKATYRPRLPLGEKANRSVGVQSKNEPQLPESRITPVFDTPVQEPQQAAQQRVKKPSLFQRVGGWFGIKKKAKQEKPTDVEPGIIQSDIDIKTVPAQ